MSEFEQKPETEEREQAPNASGYELAKTGVEYGEFLEHGEAEPVEAPGMFGTGLGMYNAISGFREMMDPTKSAERRIAGGVDGASGALTATEGGLEMMGVPGAEALGTVAAPLGVLGASMGVTNYGSGVLKEYGVLGQNGDGSNRDASDMASDWGMGLADADGGSSVAEVTGTIAGSAVGGLASLGGAAYGMLRSSFDTTQLQEDVMERENHVTVVDGPGDVVPNQFTARKVAAARKQAQGQHSVGEDLHNLMVSLASGTDPDLAGANLQKHMAQIQQADAEEKATLMRAIGMYAH